MLKKGWTGRMPARPRTSWSMIWSKVSLVGMTIEAEARQHDQRAAHGGHSYRGEDKSEPGNWADLKALIGQQSKRLACRSTMRTSPKRSGPIARSGVGRRFLSLSCCAGLLPEHGPAISTAPRRSSAHPWKHSSGFGSWLPRGNSESIAAPRFSSSMSRRARSNPLVTTSREMPTPQHVGGKLNFRV